MIGPAHAPAPLVRKRPARVLVEREIRDGDEPPFAIEQRNPLAHPRHDAAPLEPRFEPPMTRVAGGLETLAAGAETHVESFSRPRFGETAGSSITLADGLEHDAAFRAVPRQTGGDALRLARCGVLRRARRSLPVAGRERREAAVRRLTSGQRTRRKQIEPIA